MIDFIGEYEVSVDAKGRFLLPAGFRKQLPEGYQERFVVNRGFENCLSMYTMEEWDKLSQKINSMNDFHPKVRLFKRSFRSGANIVESDSAGRILVPKLLLEHAGVKKDMVFSAQGNKVELWDKDTYYEYLRKAADGFSDLAAEVAGDSFLDPFQNL